MLLGAGLLAALAAVAAAPAHGDPLTRGVPPAVAEGPPGRVALSGPWVERDDPADQGLARGWSSGRFGGRSVSVPYSPNAVQTTGRAGVVSDQGSVAWYRAHFAVPRDGDYALDFESVNHVATVWLDGRLLGSHTGEFLPFELRARMRSARVHTLVVRADWRDPKAMKAQGWHQTWFNFGGINREVTLRPLGSADITAPDVRTQLLPGGAARVTVTATVANLARARTVTLTGALGPVPLRFAPGRLARGASARFTSTVVVERPDLWGPGHPALYRLRLDVPGQASWRQRVGLRELTWRGGELRLNGRPLRLRGASLQEDAPGRGDALTSADMDAIVGELQAIGANATRAQHPLSPALLERLDAAGILVWQGIGPIDSPGSWTSTTPALQAAARARVRVSVAQLAAHPSIVAWNLANEVAGQGHPGGQAQYVDAMARELHRTDPGRMVAVDIWGTHPPRASGLLYRDVDAIGLTNYAGWYEDTFAGPRALAAAIDAKVRALQRALPGKVLVISEFGAEANAQNPSGVPGGYAFQSRVLARGIRAYAALPGVDGMLVWVLRDYAVAPTFAGGSIRRTVASIALVRGTNQKGLFDRYGRPKPAVAVVRAAFARLGD
ncbi:MAG TPA: glycoside hydrolase family 2 TIM barrel-domain containing protein [Solirubrobacteraceae bacterium]|nr:glycoside hydrolase family 2 TIM barrel-domain containing protein [Solirubrobacteraceae bacterium]